MPKSSWQRRRTAGSAGVAPAEPRAWAAGFTGAASGGLIVLATVTLLLAMGCSSAGNPGMVRHYFIAADPVVWDFAPLGKNGITGQAFTEEQALYATAGARRIGSQYRKSIYREYTDASFRTLKPSAAPWQTLGLLGPLIRAEVGDTIEVDFKNNTPFPASIHPHGVLYQKDAEGTPYNDGTTAKDKLDDRVPPGGSYTYRWQVPERSGPGPMDGSSVLWMYHSHVDEVADTNSGLVGPLIITKKGLANPDGSPKDIDQECVAYFSIIDENKSLYLEQNSQKLRAQTGLKLADEDFVESNKKHTINGYIFGNGPQIHLRAGSHVRWYLMSLGSETDLHTPHWHGVTALVQGMRMDMVNLLPGAMMVADMVPDNPGTWLFHCHVNDHILAGMQALFVVEPSARAQLDPKMSLQNDSMMMRNSP